MRNLNKDKMYNTVIIDNFFDNPDYIVDYSKSLDYKKSDMRTEGNFWPGERSESIEKYDKDLFNFIVEKILSSYYNFNFEKVLFEGANIYFHRIPSDMALLNSTHNDTGKVLAAVIYLNKDNSIKTGTTICDKNGKSKVIVGNYFNTMVSYDATKLHTPTGYDVSSDFRLTISAFIENIKILEA